MFKQKINNFYNILSDLHNYRKTKIKQHILETDKFKNSKPENDLIVRENWRADTSLGIKQLDLTNDILDHLDKEMEFKTMMEQFFD